MAFNSEHSMVDKISECLSQQVSEFELLKSMYPKHDEIVLTNIKILEEIQNYILRKSESVPNHLDFVVTLHMNEKKLEIFVDLPSLYPIEQPDIYVRCNQLNRLQETLLNRELSNYIQNNYFGEVCLYTAISWLQDNAEIFLNDSSKIALEQNHEDTIEDKFVRMWIYSHHIYNKKKKEEIVKLAKELHLTGFCLPGKPGIICIEGSSRDCSEWWKHIKSMSWQKIGLKMIEKFEANDQKEEQKFDRFEEIAFLKSSSKNDKHQDMSAFSRFMDEHGLSQAFNECFGLDV